MPHYHLNIHNGHGPVPDEEGAYYRDLDAARQEAIRGVRSMLSAEALEGEINLDGHLDITDDRGTLIEKVLFTEAVKIVGA